MIKFGPAGNDDEFHREKLGSMTEAVSWLRQKGLDLYEISFGLNITVKDSITAIKLHNKSIENDIQLSVHAPYYINFANPDEEKIGNSINYVLNSLRIMTKMGAKFLVIHSGTQLKLTREEAMKNIITRYKELIEIIKNEGIEGIYLAPETMGKYSQIGNVDEVLEICKLDEMLIPTFDFGHINCITQGSLKSKEDFTEIIKKCYKELGAEKTKKMHIHFSKILYNDKGEIKHLTFEDTKYGPDYRDMIDALIENDVDEATVICESRGTMAQDALKMKQYYLERIKERVKND